MLLSLVRSISSASRFLVEQTIKTVRCPGRIPIILTDPGNPVGRAANVAAFWLWSWPRRRALLLRSGEYGLRDVDALKKQRAPAYDPIQRRVLMVVPTMTRAGCERRLLATAAGLIENGYAVDVLVLRPLPPGTPAFAAEFQKLGAVSASDVLATAGRGPGDWREALHEALLQPRELVFARAISAAIHRFRPEVVHGWGDEAATLAGLVACLLGVPRVVLGQTAIAPVNYAHGDAEIFRTRYRVLLQNPAVRLVTNSRASAIDYERWLGLPTNTIPVVHNGLLPGAVRLPSPGEIAAYRAKLGFSPAAPVIGSLMRFEQQKDPILWLQTAAEIARSRPDARFVLVGYGSLRDEVTSLVAALGLQDRCVVEGPVEDVSLVYAALDVFLLTSRFEGLPNTLVELQSIGCPIVATDCPGAREAMVENVTGFIAPERSAKSLAGKVIDILGNPAWARRARARGRAFVGERFSYRRMVAKTIELYESHDEAHRRDLAIAAE